MSIYTILIELVHIYLFIILPIVNGDNKSGPPKFIKFISQFPISSLIIQLNPPVEPNGNISNYLISLQRSDGVGDCVLWNYNCGLCQKITPNNSIKTGCLDGKIMTISTGNLNDIKVSITDESFVINNKTYTLKSQASNSWGWGELLSIEFNTNKLNSSAPIFGPISSKFPYENIKIAFTPPKTRDGQILTYLVFIMSPKNTSCILWNMTCSDCKNKIVGYKGKKIVTTGCSSILNYSAYFKMNDTNSSVSSNNKELVPPYTTFNIQIQARSVWGWTDFSETNFTTAQIKMGRPILVRFLSYFPQSQIIIQLSPPPRPNGELLHYAVSLQRTDGIGDCVFWILDCKTCTGKMGLHNMIETGCTNDRKINVASADMVNIRVDITDHSFVVPEKEYILKAQGNNGWGWGDVLNTTFHTTQYNSVLALFLPICLILVLVIAIAFGLLLELKTRKPVKKEAEINEFQIKVK